MSEDTKVWNDMCKQEQTETDDMVRRLEKLGYNVIKRHVKRRGNGFYKHVDTDYWEWQRDEEKVSV